MNCSCRRILWGLLVPALVAALVLADTLNSEAALGASQHPAGMGASHSLPLQERTAEIVNSGSTNTAGYRILVKESGDVTFIPGKPRSRIGPPNPETDAERSVTIPPDLAKRFFDDIDHASPLSKLPVVHCMKSVSFGTLTFIKLGDERSPDVSCPGKDERLGALYHDAQEILEAVKKAKQV
ncbi:MAG TPA: hypothetical protein VEZ90_15365 [Blastocatellia bacterium]|nr:hypothetical protein [Blastocatellia bacterium]